MKKKLPDMFVNKIGLDAGNNNNYFCSYKEERTMDETKKNIPQKIKEIFSSSNFVYKADVEITINGQKVTKRIVGRNNIYLITIDNELIPISDITDIKRK